MINSMVLVQTTAAATANAACKGFREHVYGNSRHVPTVTLDTVISQQWQEQAMKQAGTKQPQHNKAGSTTTQQNNYDGRLRQDKTRLL